MQLFRFALSTIILCHLSCSSQQNPSFPLDKYFNDFFSPPLAYPSQREMLQEHSMLLLDALTCGDVETASKYATLAALQDVLYLDIDKIEHYVITDLTINRKKGKAAIYLNKEKKPFKFQFRKDTIWRFTGINYKKESHRLRHIYYPHLY